jgi:hypothetical protein
MSDARLALFALRNRNRSLHDGRSMKEYNGIADLNG